LDHLPALNEQNKPFLLHGSCVAKPSYLNKMW